MKTYNANVLRKEYTALHLPSIKYRDVVKKLVAGMSNGRALGEWELHTLEDMIWNGNHQRPSKYWS